MTVPALGINKVCLSGLDAIALAAQLIRAGEFDVIVAGGMESMSQAPHLLAGSRRGFKYGDTALIDSMAHDGLTDAFDQVSMGESTERHNGPLGISREAQDEFAARSHQLAAAAIKNGLLAPEITPVSIPQRRGEPLIVDTDEGVRADTTAESLGRLKPAFAAGRHDHGRLGLADQRRGLRGRGDVGGGRGGRRGHGAGRGRRAWRGGRAGQLAAVPAGQRDQARARQGRPDRRGPGPGRDQRGLRRGRDPVRSGTSASTTTRSTSTAAPSRSAIRWALPVPGSRCT